MFQTSDLISVPDLETGRIVSHAEKLCFHLDAIGRSQKRNKIGEENTFNLNLNEE